MPTKLLEGFTEFLKVSSDTAMPLIPAYPSPPPGCPSAVGAVALASARVKVSPSAPVPDPMDASNAAEIPTPGTAVGQKADPAWFAVAAVSWRLGGDADDTRVDDPLSCHPPAVGDGITTGGFPALYVNWSLPLVALVPSGVVTRTSTDPEPAGAVAVMVVALLTTKDVAGFTPKATAVAPVKLVPLTVPAVPPDAPPEFGARPPTVGGGVPPV